MKPNYVFDVKIAPGQLDSAKAGGLAAYLEANPWGVFCPECGGKIEVGLPEMPCPSCGLPIRVRFDS